MKVPQLQFPNAFVFFWFAFMMLLTIFPARMLAATSKLSGAPAALAYGDVELGQTKTLVTKLTNGGSSAITVTSAGTNNGQFATSGLKLPKVIAAGATLNVSVIFTPSKTGSDDATLKIVSSAKNPTVTIALSGTGTAAKAKLAITPGTLNFGSVAVGTTSTLTVGLTASGGSVDLSSIKSNSSAFAAPGVQLPLTIPNGKEMLVNVTFTPKKDGSASGTMTFTSDASDSPTSESLSGTGTAPYVSLTWIASQSPDIVGYNIYRSNTKGGVGTKINSTLDRHTDYDDSTVVSGKTYYYSSTAVNSSGQESRQSEQAKAVVP